MYQYEVEKKSLLSVDGIRLVLQVKANADRLIGEAGCATIGSVLGNITGDTWKQLAAIDLLVEIGHLQYVDRRDFHLGQHRILVWGNPK